MRKLIIVFLSVSLFAACNNKKDEKKTDVKEEKTSDVKESGDKEKPKEEETTNTSSDWNSSDVSAFVDNCTSEAVRKGMQQQKASDYCNCMQRKLEVMYPKKAEVAGLDIESPTIKSMIQKCLE
ncbi:MAG TPA: hypothetical protein VMZ03_08180 [Chitinophagaceae bacterium]|nr:hypothetical protein [Chitinophagaceae bacterium]